MRNRTFRFSGLRCPVKKARNLFKKECETLAYKRRIVFQ